MGYSYRIFDSIEHVDASEWQHVRSACNGSIFMDPQFIAAVEAGMKQVEKIWYIVVHDEAVLRGLRQRIRRDDGSGGLRGSGPGAHHPIPAAAAISLRRSSSSSAGCRWEPGTIASRSRSPRRARGSFPCWTG